MQKPTIVSFLPLLIHLAFRKAANQFEYIDEATYMALIDRNDIVLNTSSYENHYGYRKENLRCAATQLMNCSATGLLENIGFPCIRVLVEGDSNYGLTLRGERIDLVRQQANEEFDAKFFQSEIYRMNIDVFFKNNFKKTDELAIKLDEEIGKAMIKFGKH